jgi:hypothetical protein
VGSGSGQRHRRGAIHGGAARRRDYSTPVRNYTRQRAKQRAIGAGEVPYLKVGSGDSSAATETRRWPGSTVAAARRTAGERGQREIGRGMGNWCAFRVADVGAKLTVAMDTAELQRRGLRRRRSGVRAARERWKRGAGWCANEGGGGGEQGSGLKWPRARWGEPHARRGRGDRGTHGGGYAKTEKPTSRARGAEREKKAGAGAREAGLTGRAHGQRESEGAGVRGETAAPTGGAGRAERGRRVRGRRPRRQAGPAAQREEGGRGARARWADWAERPRGAGKWAALPFSFILNCFSLFLFTFPI